MTKLRSTFAAAAFAIVLLALPSSAAAEPTVAYPTAAAVASGTPSFGINHDATGVITRIYISTSSTLVGPTLDTTSGAFIDVTPSTTLAVSPRPLFARTYSWQYSWNQLDANGQVAGVKYSSVKDFTNLASYRKLTIKAPVQSNRSPQVNLEGIFQTNSETNKVTCAVYKGRKKLSSRTKTVTARVPFGGTKWACSGMVVPESYDGQRVTAKLTVVGSGKSATASRAFTAK